MDRRGFFTFGLRKATELAEKKVQEKFPRIGLRPPGAITENEFLMKCTRCGECKKACPHEAIFTKSIEDLHAYGETPFIDVNEKACAYCEDFPCIEVCEPNALISMFDIPLSEENHTSLKLADIVFHEEHCLVTQGQYCDYCKNPCPKGIDALEIGSNKLPVIDHEKCVGCGQCAYICTAQTGDAFEVIPL